MCDRRCSAPVWDEQKKAISFPSAYARGLTKVLTAAFTPRLSAGKAIATAARKPKKRGRHLGNVADADLSAWANGGSAPVPGKDARFDYVVALLDALKWIPVAGQLCVGCETLRLGTKIDLVVMDTSAKVIIIELKCGFDDYFCTEGQGHMKAPFDTQPSTFKNRALVQLLLSDYLFRHSLHRFSDYVYEGAYLLHVFEDDQGNLQHNLDVLPQWSIDGLPKALDVLQSIEPLFRRRYRAKRSKRSKPRLELLHWGGR